MERRTALKLLGAMVVCSGGKSVMAEQNDLKVTGFSVYNAPYDYLFCSSQIKNIIIRTETGRDIVIPFSEIIEALEAR